MFILAELDKSENISTFKKVMHLNRGDHHRILPEWLVTKIIKENIRFPLKVIKQLVKLSWELPDKEVADKALEVSQYFKIKVCTTTYEFAITYNGYGEKNVVLHTHDNERHSIPRKAYTCTSVHFDDDSGVHITAHASIDKMLNPELSVDLKQWAPLVI